MSWYGHKINEWCYCVGTLYHNLEINKDETCKCLQYPSSTLRLFLVCMDDATSMYITSRLCER